MLLLFLTSRRWIPEGMARQLLGARLIGGLELAIHFSAYAVLGGLLVRALMATQLHNAWMLSLLLLLIVSLALGQEAMQEWVATRGASLADVLVNLAGGLMGGAGELLRTQRRKPATQP